MHKKEEMKKEKPTPKKRSKTESRTPEREPNVEQASISKPQRLGNITLFTIPHMKHQLSAANADS